MTTFTGNQENFLDALKDLVELEYDTRVAYQEAVSKIDNENYRIKLNEFCEDHEIHIMELSRLLEDHNETVPNKPSTIKPLVTKGKVKLAEMIGDRSILSAMASNEVDTNKAYERMNARHDKWDDSKEILKRLLEDERRHKEWLDEQVKLHLQ